MLFILLRIRYYTIFEWGLILCKLIFLLTYSIINSFWLTFAIELQNIYLFCFLDFLTLDDKIYENFILMQEQFGFWASTIGEYHFIVCKVPYLIPWFNRLTQTVQCFSYLVFFMVIFPWSNCMLHIIQFFIIWRLCFMQTYIWIDINFRIQMVLLINLFIMMIYNVKWLHNE